jgi:hypothetical protein
MHARTQECAAGPRPARIDACMQRQATDRSIERREMVRSCLRAKGTDRSGERANKSVGNSEDVFQYVLGAKRVWLLATMGTETSG